MGYKGNRAELQLVASISPTNCRYSAVEAISDAPHRLYAVSEFILNPHPRPVMSEFSNISELPARVHVGLDQ